MNKKRTFKYELFTIIFADTLLWSFAASALFDTLYDKFGEAVVNDSVAVNLGYFLVSLLFLVIFNIPLSMYLMKRVDKPIQKISSGLRQVTDGNYSVRLEAGSPNEFGNMCESFNSMTARLEAAEVLQKKTENERILLFANMAHDLKTPITTILGFSKALSDGMVSDREKEREYLRVVALKAVKMNDLIDRLFEYVKLESVDNIMHKENTDLAELLRECIGGVFNEFEDKGMKVTIDIPEKKLVRLVDRLEVSRVCTNLLDNVLVHNPEGTEVLVRLDATGSITVADSGPALSAETVGSLFTPFSSGDASRMSRGGSGLGLALSFKIMQRHGGTLSYAAGYPGYTKAFVASFPLLSV